MKTVIPRPEYPRPQFERKDWQNLNGEWEFYIDWCNTGAERKIYEQDKLDGEQKIIVPFCPESPLSGIEFTDFMPAVWYAKNVQISQEQLQGHVILHIGACDYETHVYVNGQKIGKHIGGYTSFSFDIVSALKEGENHIVIQAIDDIRSGKQPSGKQGTYYNPDGIVYTRTTGIWQTVWLEFLEGNYLSSVKVNATNLSGKVLLNAKLNAYVKNAKLKVEVSFNSENLLEETFDVDGVENNYAIDIAPVYLWEAGQPNLYDIKYTLLIEKKEVDTVESYFGIRRIDIDGYKILINGKSVFQRLVLDQGYYPDGIITAPTDEDLKKDIENSLRLGFNGARLHQKVFEERFLYYADKMGYLVWSEYGTWGMDLGDYQALHTFLPEWLESVERDYNHPCIIGWCPHNETYGLKGKQPIKENIALMYTATKVVDNTRPVLDTSGWFHTDYTDVFDVHDYQQDAEKFAEHYEKHAKGEFFVTMKDKQSYDGKMPYMVNEFGGMRWNRREGDSKWGKGFGYSDTLKTPEDFATLYGRLAEIVLNTPNITGFCYTQLVDVETEENGLYYYDRKPKFTENIYDKIREANTQKAKIEE